MKSKLLKSGHIKLYKRENSNYWQMKIKLPKQKAIRSSTGSKILKESEKIALKYYSSLSKENKFHIKKRSKQLNMTIRTCLIATGLNKKILDKVPKFIFKSKIA